MALQTKRGNALPPGVVPLSREEALEYQRKFIRNWPSEMDVLFLKYGNYMTAATTIVSSSIIMKFFKQYFKLRFSPNFYATYLTCGILPSFLSFFVTEKFITNNVLLMKMDCPVCDELKFAISQLYISVGYPATSAYFSLGAQAQAEKTYALPNIKIKAREFWRETFRIFKESAHILKFTALSQSVWILFLPYMQNKQLHNVSNKARENIFNEDFNEFNELENNAF